MFSLLPHFRVLLITSFLALLTACGTGNIKDVLNNQKPRVSVADQRLTHLDFNKVTLAFDIKIDNPNPVGISLGGLDYDLKLAGHSFASGKQDRQMKLKASGSSYIELPVSVSFNEIYQGLGKLRGKDEVPYELTTGLMLDVPLLGKLRYPVTASGVMPLPRAPQISVKSINLQKLTLSSATLALKLGVDNPNAFGVALDKLNYDFKINGKRWLSGNRASLGKIAAKHGSEVTLPITLNFLQMGSGLYDLLRSDKPLNYSLSGNLNATADHKLLGSFALPINSSGAINLQR
ncbi:MAG: LEA type 2 family protein [Chromatiales bacterium]|nr:LEA type 2 family protein [Chromatiales bacterium]